MWQVIVQHFDVEEIKEMNWRDIFLGLPGNSVRNKFVNSLLLMLKYYRSLSLERRALYPQ